MSTQSADTSTNPRGATTTRRRARRPSLRPRPPTPRSRSPGLVVMAAASASFEALGTSAGVTVADEDALPQALGLVQDELRLIDETCSRFRDDSELDGPQPLGRRPVRGQPAAAGGARGSAARRRARPTATSIRPSAGRCARSAGIATSPSSRAGDTPRLRTVPAAGWTRVAHRPTTRCTVSPPGRCGDRSRRDRQGAGGRPLRARRARARRGAGVLVNLGGDIALAGTAPGEGWPIRVTDDHRSDLTADGQTIALAGGGLATSSTTVRRWRAGDVDVPPHRRSAHGPAGRGRLAHRQRRGRRLRAGQRRKHRRDRARRGGRRMARARRASCPPRARRRLARAHVRLALRGRRVNGALTSGPVWYLMRGSGVVSLLLLTAVSALGMATVSRWRLGRAPRFVTLGLHRNLSLLALVFLALHVLSAVIDPDASVRADRRARAGALGSLRRRARARRPGPRSRHRAHRDQPSAPVDLTGRVAHRALAGLPRVAGRAPARSRHRHRQRRAVDAAGRRVVHRDLRRRRPAASAGRAGRRRKAPRAEPAGAP